MKDLLTGRKLGAKIQSQTEYPYLERWRDWPYEARQPAIFIAMVPIPARLRRNLGR